MTTFNWNAIEASLWLSLFAAPLGSLLVFRRLSFFGDALSHSSLAGIAIVYVMVGASPLWLPVGALISVLISAWLLHFLEKKMNLPSDVALTVSYSGMFAIGVLFVSSGELDLEHLLLGDIWAIQPNMVWFLRIWSLIVLGILFSLWRPLWASVLDPRFAKGLGYKTNAIDFLFLALTAISVVGLIQSVGVILIAAYLVLPAATVLPWVKSLRALAVGSVIAAMLSSMIGAEGSFFFHLPAGPCIATVGFAIFMLSQLGKTIFR